MRGLDPRAAALAAVFTGEPVEGPDGLYRVALSVQKANGQRIRCLLTSPGESWQGVIIGLSGLGRTIRHSNALALTAAHHGYATLRFDPSNHVGDSDGEMCNATLSNIAADLFFVCEFLRRSGWNGILLIAAASLFARCAIKLSGQGLPVNGMILTLPVVDFAKTLMSVTGEDYVSAFRAERVKITDSIRIISHDILAEFIADAIEHGYCDIETTRAELRQAKMPIAMLAAEGDDWVSVADIVAALEPGRPDRTLYLLENTTHDSYSFGFVRAVTQTTIRALAAMTGETIDPIYEVTFSKLSKAVDTEKKILNQARKSWGTHG